jgi:hypothetical protein
VARLSSLDPLNGRPSKADSRTLVWLWAVTLVAAGGVSVYAGLALRGLTADGAFFLLLLLMEKWFALFEPSRVFTLALEQLPTVLLLRSGIATLESAAICYSLSLMVIPVVLVWISYGILPREHRYRFVFPLFFYLAGVMSSSFIGFGVAGGYFWCLLFLVLHIPLRTATRGLLVLLSLPTLLLNEMYVFLGPILVIASSVRLRSATAGRDRLLLRGLQMVYLGATLAAAYFIAFPRSSANRESVVDAMFGLKLIVQDGLVNPPVILGIFAGLGLIIGLPSGKGITTRRSAILAAVSIAAGVTAISPMISERAFSLVAQFAARYYAECLIPLLCITMWWVSTSPALQKALRSRFTVAMLVILAAGQTGWHLATTHHWLRYLGTFREILDTKCGVVELEDALEGYPVATQENVRRMTWGWTNPTMSLILSPGGRVRTIVANPVGVEWQPFDPRNPGRYADSDFFDLAEFEQCSRSAGTR